MKQEKSFSTKNKNIIINLSEEEINRRIDQIESLSCDDDLRQFLIDALRALVELDRIMGLKETTLARLRKIFNKKSEKQSPEGKPPKPKNPPKKRDKGKNGKDDYPNAAKCFHAHESLKLGDTCPLCGIGTLGKYDSGIHIKITGTPPLTATIHETEKFRCSACLEIFEANFDGKNDPKYDAGAKAIIAVLKYEASTPFYRLEKIQKQMRTPMPASTQFDLMEELANDLHVIWCNLITLAAEADLFYFDDTKGKILALILENQKNIDKKTRKGMYTTGIIAESEEFKIVLYFSGRNYAGENLNKLLENRKSPDIPITMSDASRTNKLEKETVVAYCNTHSRRKFVDLSQTFENETDYVIKQIGQIYKNDRDCVDENKSPEERMMYHLQNSLPIMKELKVWGQQVFADKKVEENSSLGKAIQYLINHWTELTEFTRVPGVPLDNNFIEQQLRTQVLNRKNWLFYRTEFGALIGDIISSIIKTCLVSKINPYDYLVWVQNCMYKGCELFVLDHFPSMDCLPAISLIDEKVFSHQIIDGQINTKELKSFKIENSPINILNFKDNSKVFLNKIQCEFIKSKGGHYHDKVKSNPGAYMPWKMPLNPNIK